MSRSSMVFGGLVFANLLLVALPSQAATELEKFKAKIPRGIKFRVIDGDLTLCALKAFTDSLNHQDKPKVPYEEYKAQIAACDKPISAYDIQQVERLGMGPEELNAARKLYRELFYAEEKLKYYKKPVPGYVQDPWVTKVLTCEKSIRESKASYLICTDKAVREIAPFSADPCDVVALAVTGRCEPLKSQMVTMLLSCSLDNQQAASAVSNFTESVRSQILGKVVSFRAEMNKRRLSPGVLCGIVRRELQQGISANPPT